MKKVMMFALAVLICASVAMARRIHKGHRHPRHRQIGRSPERRARLRRLPYPSQRSPANGGTLQWDAASGTFKSVPTVGDSGDDALWGQDLGQIIGIGSIATGTSGAFPIEFTDLETRPRIKTGVVMCLSCHDGNVAKGAMMTNQSFEQAAGLLPPGYGLQPIPTLLGNDGGAAGNYTNDHPIGPEANIGGLSISTTTNSTTGAIVREYVALNAAKTAVIEGSTFAASPYEAFQKNYGLPTVIGARTWCRFRGGNKHDYGEPSVLSLHHLPYAAQHVHCLGKLD